MINVLLICYTIIMIQTQQFLGYYNVVLAGSEVEMI